MAETRYQDLSDADRRDVLEVDKESKPVEIRSKVYDTRHRAAGIFVVQRLMHDFYSLKQVTFLRRHHDLRSHGVFP